MSPENIILFVDNLLIQYRLNIRVKLKLLKSDPLLSFMIDNETGSVTIFLVKKFTSMSAERQQAYLKITVERLATAKIKLKTRLTMIKGGKVAGK